MRIAAVLLFLLVPAIPAISGEVGPMDRALALEKAGDDEAAFLAFLGIDGAEFRAARLARRDPARYLHLLGRTGPEVPARRARLIAADLLLLLGKREEALTLYRDVAADQAGTDRYPVEPARETRYPVRPFQTGPGSHRDHWLIRRFLALDALTDAAREFERLRAIHEPREPDRGAFFSGSGLLFTLDYAYFLFRTGREEEAADALAAPIKVMDMDRVRGPFPGATRKEFIRLALGELEERGRAAEVVAAVAEQVRRGDLRAFRVLAEIRRQQERMTEARDLELAYLAKADLPELSRLYREGLILEANQLTARAAETFERALDAPWSAPVLPQTEPGDPDFPPAPQQVVAFWEPPTEARFKAGILHRLERLYTALGRTDDMLRVVLERIETLGGSLLDLDPLERTAERFRAGRKMERFTEWARGLALREEKPYHAANLFFVSGDYAAAAAAVARTIRTTTYANADYRQWMRGVFRKAGEQPCRLLLAAMVAADPEDARSRLELLDLDGEATGDRAIAVMEEILTGQARYDFRRPFHKGRQIEFGSPFALALRLMHLLERAGRNAKIVELGLRIARGAEPFAGGDPDEDAVLGNAGLARAIRYADPDSLAALAAALETSRWKGALAQARRRQAGGPKFRPPADYFGWANLPAGVSAIAGNEFVLTVAADEKYVYAGEPWGIAVFDHQGRAVTRVALADCGLAIAARDGRVFVGGTTGLFVIEREAWRVAHLRLDRDLGEKRPADRYHRDNMVLGLALDGDQLWIAVRGTAQVLDLARMELRVFAPDEVEVEQLFVIEDDYVWADGDGHGIYRYERKTDTWTKVPGNHRDLDLIGDVDGELFGSVNLGDPLRHRPCLIDRKTLAVTPVFFESPDPEHPVLINHELSFYGRLRGLPVFGAESPRYLYDPARRRLNEIADVYEGGRDELRSELPPGELRGDFRRYADGRFGADYVSVLTLRNGTRVVGRHQSHSPRYRYRKEDWPFEVFPRGPATDAGGLFFRPTDGPSRRVSAIPRADSIPGTGILCFADDPAGRTWLGTGSGLAVLDDRYRVVATFTESDGLLANRITGAAALGPELSFATGWGADQGGLIVFHPDTGVFTSLLAEDGLPVEKLRSVAGDGRALVLTPAVVRERNSGGRSYLAYPPFHYHPETGAFTDPGPATVIEDQEANRLARGEMGESMPVFDGFVIAKHRAGDRRLIIGTRGLLVVPDGVEPRLDIEELDLPVVPGYRAAMMADAKQRRPLIKTRAGLERALEDENPWYRAAALTTAGYREDPEFVPLAVATLDDPLREVRAAALYLLTRIDDGALVVPHLRRVLDDPDPVLRAHATIELCRHGAPPDAAFLADVLGRRDGYPPIGGVGAGRMELYTAVAPHATPEIFAVLLDHPLGTDDYEPRQQALRELGGSLRKHPEAVPILMTATTPEQIRFVRAVCGHAGGAILPALLESLESDDRVERSNAAIALGAAGDLAAIPPLLRALDRESGLSRAGAVQALGDLKAIEALPRLTELYLSARSDPGGGYRAGQADFGYRREYERIEGFDVIAAAWDELQSALRADRPRPAAGERLLTPELILDSIRRIGPEASFPFYRRLAASGSTDARREAAIGLAACPAEGLDEAVAILESLLLDGSGLVRAEAAVSLALLDREDGRRAVEEALRGKDEDATWSMLRALRRVTDRERIGFALSRLEEIRDDRSLPEGWRRQARDLLRDLAE